MSCQRDKRVPELNGRCIRFALPQRRLVCRFPTLVVESNLVRACRPFPAELQRHIVAAVVEPRCFRRPVPIGALPHLAHPPAIDAPLPADASGRGQSVRRPCSGFCGVFQYPAELAHGLKRGSKASAVVARAVMLATPPLVIDRRKRAPQLARRVRNNRPRPTVFAGVALFRPCINSWQFCIASIRLYKNGGNVSHNNSFKADAASSFPLRPASLRRGLSPVLGFFGALQCGPEPKRPAYSGELRFLGLRGANADRPLAPLVGRQLWPAWLFLVGGLHGAPTFERSNSARASSIDLNVRPLRACSKTHSMNSPAGRGSRLGNPPIRLRAAATVLFGPLFLISFPPITPYWRAVIVPH